MSSTQELSVEGLREELRLLERVQHLSNRSVACAQPFNFMGLPTELRLMVYERIPCQINHTRVDLPPHHADDAPMITLITRTCSTAILRTSRTVHEESKKIVLGVANQWIMPHPIRLISSRSVALEVVDKIIGEVLKSHPEQHDMTKDKCYCL
jgi:hypothetical protein